VHGAPWGAPKYAWGATLCKDSQGSTTSLLIEKEIIPQFGLLVNNMQQEKSH